jgi:hypothetical protein
MYIIKEPRQDNFEEQNTGAVVGGETRLYIVKSQSVKHANTVQGLTDHGA